MRFEDVFAFLEDIHIDFISYDESPKSHQSLGFDLPYSFSGEGVFFSDFLEWSFFSAIKSKFFHQNESLLWFAVEEYFLELRRFDIYFDFFIVHFGVEVHRNQKIRIKTGISSLFACLTF